MAIGRASVVFNADSSQYLRSLRDMDQATAKSAQTVDEVKAKQRAWYNVQIEGAAAAGKSQQELARIAEASAKSMAETTETNFKKMDRAIDETYDNYKRKMAEMANLPMPKLVPLPEHGGLNDVPNRLKTSTVLRVSEGSTSIRGAEAFISAVPALSKLADFVFPVASAIGFIAIIGEGVSKLKEMYETAEQLPNALAEGLANISRPLMANVDSLQQQNDMLDATIAKIEHKPVNNLALAMDDARKRTDELANSARTASDAVEKLLKDNKVGLMATLQGHGSTGTLSTEMNRRYASITAAQTEDEKQLHRDDFRARTLSDPQARDAAMKQAMADHQARLTAIDKQLADAQTYIQSTRGTINGNVKLYDTGGGYVGTESYAQRYGDQTENNKILNGAEDIFDQMQQLRALIPPNVEKTGIAKGLQGGKGLAGGKDNALEDLKYQFLQLGAMAPEVAIAFWKKFADSSNEQVAIYAMEQAKRFKEEFEKGLEHSGKVREFLDKQEKLANLDKPYVAPLDMHYGNTRTSGQQLATATGRAKLANLEFGAEIARTKVQIDLANGSISKQAADQRLAAIAAGEHKARLKELNDELAQFKKNAAWDPIKQRYGSDKEQEQYLGLTGAIGKEQTQATIDAQKNAAQEAADSWKTSLENAYDLWYQHARDTAAQVADLFNQGIQGANQNLVDMMSGDYKRGDWKRYGHNMLKAGAGDLLEQSEAKFLGPLGMGKKADGSKENPWYVLDASQSGSSSGGGLMQHIGGLGKLFGGQNSDSSSSAGGGQSSGGIGGFFKSLLGSLFGGGSGGSGGGGDLSTTDSGDMGDFGGGFALGGGVDNSGFYDVGEMGRERVFLPRGSYVQPHNQTGGGGASYSISVANGVTPEQMDMKIRSALQEFHPHVVRASVQAVHDHQARQARRYS